MREGGIRMSMNAISARLAQKNSRDESSQDETTNTDSLLSIHDVTPAHLDGFSTDDLRKLREGPAKVVNLEELKQRYEGMTGLGRRIAPRFSVEMTVVIFSSNQSFRTRSLNVSATGVLLHDLLPVSFMSTKIEVLLIHEDPATRAKRHLLFHGEAVGGPLRTQRVVFKASAQKAAETLQGLLVGLTPIPS